MIIDSNKDSLETVHIKRVEITINHSFYFLKNDIDS